MSEKPNPRDPKNQVLSVVKKDRDGKDAVFSMTAENWQTFVPTKWRPACPACGCACRPGRGSGTAVEGPDGGTRKEPDYIYFCERCEKHPHVMDTTFGFQNAFSVAAPGQAKTYYRDVALALNDVHIVTFCVVGGH
eukprot:scaffold43901_cov81-Phaeocystis_antarctica.AAC.1